MRVGLQSGWRIRAVGAALIGSLYAVGANIWDGGAYDQRWGSAENWDNNSLPTTYSTSTITFGSGSGSDGAFLESNRSFGTLSLTWDGNFALWGAEDFSARTLGLYSGITVGDTQSAGRTYSLSSSVDVDLRSNNAWTVANPTAGGTNKVNVYGGVDLGSYTLTIDGTGTVAVSGVVTGTGGLTKNGTGTLTLTDANSFSGATTVNAGILEVSKATALGTTAGATSVGDGAEVQVRDLTYTMTEGFTLSGHGTDGAGVLKSTNGTNNRISGDISLEATSTIGVDTGSKLTLSGDISGTADLWKLGGGTLVLSGDNSYSDGAGSPPYDTYLYNGTLTGASSTAFGTGVVYVRARDGDAALGANATVSNAVVISGDPTHAVMLTGTGGTFAGHILAYRDVEVTSGTSALTISGIISGNYGLTKVFNSADGTSGTVELSGANTYLGTTTVDAGTLRVTHASALGGTGVDAGTVVNSGGALAVRDGVTISGESLTLSGTGFASTGALVGSGDATWAGSVTLGADASVGGVIGERFTISGDIGDGGSSYRLQKVGDGTLVLSGTNTYSGGTLISDGALRFAAAGARPATGMLTLAGGVLETSGTFSEDLGTDIVWDSGGGGFAAYGGDLDVEINGGSGTLSWNGADFVDAGDALMLGSRTADSRVTFTNGLTIGSGLTGKIEVLDNDASATDMAEISGAVSGAGHLSKSGNGLLELSASNTYSGTTAVGTGTLRISNGQALGSTAAGTTVNRFGMLEIRSDSNVAVGAESLTLEGGSGSGMTSLRSAGGDHSWAGNITLSPGYYNPAVVTIGVDVESGSLTLSGEVSSSVGGPSLAKTGDGTLVLSGSNTYSGSTTVSDGTLRAASATALAGTRLVTVDSGATLDLGGHTFDGDLTCNGTVQNGSLSLTSGSILDGSGTIGAAVDLGSGAIVSPGNSPGIQTYSSGLDFGAGSVYEWELVSNAIGTAGIDYDQIRVTGGDLTVDPGAILDFNFDTEVVDFADSFWESVRQWTLIDFSSAGTSQGSFDSSGFTTNLDFSAVGSFSTRNISGDIVLSWMPFSVPEPTTLLLIGASLCGTCLRRRRRPV